MTRKKKIINNKNLTLGEINEKLLPISNEIEGKIKMLQAKYNFELDYAFKPITLQDLKNFKPLTEYKGEKKCI